MRRLISCKHCHRPSARLVREMKSVDKYMCHNCNKSTFVRREYGDSQGKLDYIIFNHQNKGKAFINALNVRGYRGSESAPHLNQAHFVMTDSDILGRRPRLERMRRAGVRYVFLFPHTARPNLVNDIYTEWEHTTAQFVVSQGHIEIMRRYGYSKPLHAVGWSLCPIRDFHPRLSYRNVLFAPIHPRNTDLDKKVNRAAYDVLVRLASQGAICLTVRHIRDLSESGLEYISHPNIFYYAGELDQSYIQIDQSDVVVGHQTFAWMAVARGIPTLMMAEEDMPTHIHVRNGILKTARSWDKYKDLLCYPLDILAESDTIGLLERAVRDDAEIADWKRRMIGRPFDPGTFLSALESYI